jgi:pilus assembly protein CpaB
MKTKLVLVLAIIMGLITTYLFYDYMKQYEVETTIQENMTKVLVAKEPIKKNQRISAGMVEFAEVPEMAVHPKVITLVSDIEGLYATSNIEKGESILTHRVKSEKEETLFVSKKVTEGHRAVSIGVNFVQSVSNLIEPEDYVDVIFSEQIKEGEKEVIKSEIILSKVRVLAIGRKMIESTSETEHVEYSSATLELVPADALKLVNASQRGSLQLALHTRVIQPQEPTTASANTADDSKTKTDEKSDK